MRTVTLILEDERTIDFATNLDDVTKLILFIEETYPKNKGFKIHAMSKGDAVNVKRK